MAAPAVISTGLAVSGAVSGEFSLDMILCLVAIECLANMQFLNLNHSNIASTIYAGLSSSLVPNWIVNFNNLEKDTIIFNLGIFKQNQISSLYLDNYGDSFTEIMIYVGIYLLGLLFVLFSKTENLINSAVGKAYLTAFSLLVSNILGILQGQILFSILQMLRMDLFLLDKYSILSLITGYLTMSISVGLIIFCFFRVQSIFTNKKRLKESRTEEFNKNEGAGTEIQYNWLEKKYEFMFGDLKDRSPNQFFFTYWMIAFDVTYILLILSLQKVPILQCLSIFILVLALIICSAIIRSFKKKTLAFMHFFNFSCVLIVAFLNLILAIIDAINPDFSGRETQGKFVTAVIILNTGTNALFSVGSMLLEINKKFYKKCKKDSETNHKGKSSEAKAGDEIAFPPVYNSHNSNLPQNQTVDLNNSRVDLINNSIHRRPTTPSRRIIKRQTLQDNSKRRTKPKRRNKSSSSDQGSVLQDQSVNITIPQPNPITNSIHQPTIIPSHRRIERITLEVQKNH
jgi:hypothetical protein